MLAPFRGKRNESRYLSYVADFMAKVKGVSSQEIISQTTANALDLFKISI